MTSQRSARSLLGSCETPSNPATSWHALRRAIYPMLMSILAIAGVTTALLAVNQTVATHLVPIAYLIPVIFTATQWGAWPALTASVAGMAAADFFFFAPVYSFRIENPDEVVDLLLFLIVSLVSSNLASRLRRETESLRAREKEMVALYEFSRRLASCFTVADLISAIRQHLERAFGHPLTFLVATPDGHIEPSGPIEAPPDVHAGITAMVAGRGQSSRTIVEEGGADRWLLRSIASDGAIHGVIAINIGAGSPHIIEVKTGRIEAILDATASTLQRLDIGNALKSARLHLHAQMLRDAFQGTLSHELRSPLAAIQGSASVLETIPAVREDHRVRALVDAISEETFQLDSYISNLLSATRVTAGGLYPHLEWVDPRDIVSGALKRRSRRLSAHQVRTSFAEELPLIEVDSGLIEEACGQVLENAAKYSTSGSTISIELKAEHQRVVVLISDEGVGITPDEQREIGFRSFRSERHRASVPGSGLGFWIASTFVQANSGTISVHSRGQGQGTTVAINLPASNISSSATMALEYE